MANKKIVIEYDINGKAIDVAIDKTLNLKQAVRELTKEINRTKEGTDEFRLLSSKLNETRDNMDRVKAKSGELFNTLSLLPGPIGDFGQKTQGVIDLLKTFSGFKISEVGNQFKELSKDIKDVASNLFGFKKTTDETVQTNNTLKETVKETSNSFNQTAAASSAAGEKIKTYKAQVDELRNSQKAGVGQVVDYVDGQARVVTATENATGAVNSASTGIQSLGNSETGATVKTGLLTRAFIALGLSADAAAIAVGVLETALAAIGIGIVIAGLVALGSALVDGVKWLYKYATGALAAEEATKRLAAALALTSENYDKDVKSLKRAGDEKIALLKAQGASEEAIRKQGINNLTKDRDLTAKTLGQTFDILKQLQKNRGKNDEENNKQIEAALKKKKELEEKYKDQSSSIRVAELDNITANNKAALEKQKERNSKWEEENKRHLEQIKQDNKTADEALVKLIDENAALKETDKRKREDVELMSAKMAEERTIKALEISATKKATIIGQIETKYSLKAADLKKKRQEEDLQKQKEHDDKVAEWTKKTDEFAVQAISDQTTKEKAERNKKYNEDLAELDKALKDKLVTQKQYDKAVKDLATALANDLKKIDDDKKKKDQEDKLKKLDDELKFLQIQTEAEKNSFVAYWDDRQKLLDKSKERELAAEELTGAQKAAIEKKYVQLSKDLQKEKINAYLGYVTAGLGVISGFYSQQMAINNLAMDNELKKVAGNAEEEDKIKEKYFYKNRDAQVGQAVIATLQSAIQAYSALAGIPIVGPALGAIAAAAALVFGYKQVDLIKSQTYQSASAGGGSAAKPAMANYGKNYGDGGMIDGPRHSEGGVPVVAEGGEAIMTRGAVTMFAPLLSTLNQMGGGTAFTKGAVGQANYDNPKSKGQEAQVIKTYVVSSDLTTTAEKQARLKNLSTL